ncbi:MAG: phenylacetate-CoA oxygenase subunit PaaC [Anaerolineales bacterium]
MTPETWNLILLSFADDELIAGQRAAEWCGHAPILEEDIAFANLALDEIGHASLWYRLLAELTGEDPETYPDHLAYWRNADEFRCHPLLELPNGDWAQTVLRQYLFDSAEQVRLRAVLTDSGSPLAQAARKILTEEQYHLRHTRTWVTRLARGSAESAARTQTALHILWQYIAGLFEPLPNAASLHAEWEAQQRTFLTQLGLSVPDAAPVTYNRLQHTPHLAALLAEMQSVARLDPEAVW